MPSTNVGIVRSAASHEPYNLNDLANLSEVESNNDAGYEGNRMLPIKDWLEVETSKSDKWPGQRGACGRVGDERDASEVEIYKSDIIIH